MHPMFSEGPRYCSKCGRRLRGKTVTVAFDPYDGHQIAEDRMVCGSGSFPDHDFVVPVGSTGWRLIS